MVPIQRALIDLADALDVLRPERYAWRAGLLALAFYGWVLMWAPACGPSQEAKEAAADGAYLAEHLRCVEQFDTRAEIDACRHAVRIRWGVQETVRDAGGDR